MPQSDLLAVSGTYMAKALRADITGLRAVAVLAVTLYHLAHVLLPDVKWFHGGFLGVDIFFVISGYLMTMIIMQGLERERFSLLDFYKRRAKRICPALFVTVLCFVGLAVLLVGTSDLVRLCNEGLYALLFVSNIYFAQKTDYFGNSALDQAFLHTWSLSVEWQFYIFYPLILMALRRFLVEQRYIARILFIVTILSFGFGCYYSLVSPQAAYYVLPARAFELLVGAMAYFYPLSSLKQEALLYLQEWHEVPEKWKEEAANLAGKRHKESDGWIEDQFLGYMPRRRWGVLIAFYRFCLKLHPMTLEIIGLLLIAASLVLVDDANGWPHPSAFFPLFGTYLCIAANNQHTVLRWKPIQLLGLWSYAIYLVHWPLLVFVTKLGFTPRYIDLLLPILLMGIILHYGIERRRNYGYIFLGLYVVAGAMCWYLSYSKATFRLQYDVTRYAQYGGHTVPFNGEINSIGDLSRKPDFILIGDSFARHYTLDLIDRGLHVITVFRDGCYSFANYVNVRPEGVVDQQCALRYQVAKVALERYPDLPVVVAQDWPRYHARLLRRSDHQNVELSKFAAALRQDLISLSQDFAPHKVYVIGTPRQTVFDIGSTCMYLHALDNPLSQLLGKYFTCKRTMELRDIELNQVIERVVEELPEPNPHEWLDGRSRVADVKYIDPNEAICVNGHCEILVGAYVPVFQDGLHYSWGGSVKVVSYILSQIGVEQGRVRTEFEDEGISPQDKANPLYAPSAHPLLRVE